MTASSPRFQHIDALRGFAAAAVLIQHISEKLFESHPQSRLLSRALEALLLHGCNLGRFGVMLFFLISGFVIPFSFRGHRPIRDFIISRVLRLYPCYWFSIMFAVLVGITMGVHYDFVRIAANLTMVQRLMWQANINGAYWTLFLELCFYVLAVALFWLRLLERSDVLLAAAFGGIAAALVPAVIRYGFGFWIPALSDPIFLSFMFTGAVVRRAVEDKDPFARSWLPPLVVAQIAAALILGGVLFRVIDNKNIYFAPVPLATGPVVALLLFIVSVRLRRPASSALSFLGAISYSLYLNQAVVLDLMNVLLPPGRTIEQEVVFALGVLTGSMAISVATYRLVERPSILLGRKITARAVPLIAAEVAP